MLIGSISRKQNRKKKVPTKYISANILLSFYSTAPEPSEIDFPAHFTSEINLTSFFQFPEHPCLYAFKNYKEGQQVLMRIGNTTK